MSDGVIVNTVKCRKCRHVLLDLPPHKVLDDDQAEENVVFVCEENLPYWVSDAVEEGAWTKGRLLCPGCQTRVGGFDFVSRTGGLSPIRLVRSKVDISQPVNHLAGGSSVQELNQQDTQSWSDEDSPMSSSEEEENESNTVSGHMEDSRESSSSEEEHILRSKRQKDKMRKKRRRKETLDKDRHRAKEAAEEKIRRDAKLKELLEGEPELSILPEDIVCPVCLDLLHEPYQVEPCGHIFCEPCLRRLGQKNPMSCNCPLCRTKIGFCKHLAATSREIREDHEALYLKRKKFERSTPVFSYPLPWQPGWRNLIRGRPLGGNRFLVRNNRAEVVRAIIHQVPYYVPPVMIANLINIGIFAFMMGVIEVFPNLIAMFMGTNKNMTLALNSTPGEIPENSGADLMVLPDGDNQHIEEIAENIASADQIGDLGGHTMDATFYYLLFTLSLLAAILSQFLMNHQGVANLRMNRVTDLLYVVVLTVMPLLLIPTIIPFRNSHGSWLGTIIERTVRFLFSHLNYYTAILLCFTVWFIYHVDVNEDVLW